MVWVLDEPLTPPPPLTNPAAHRPGPLTNPAQRPRPIYERGRLATLAASASAPMLDHSSFSRPQQSKENRPQRWVSSSVRPPLRMDARRGDANDESLARFISHALTLSTPDALRLAVQSVVEVLPAAHHAHFLVYQPDEMGSGDETGSGGWLELTMSHVDSAEGGSARMPQRMPVAEGVIGWTSRTGIAAVEQDASLHTAFSRQYEADLLGRSPVLVVPVRPTEATAALPPAEQLSGVLVLCGKFGSQFGALDLQLARAMLEVAFSKLSADAELKAQYVNEARARAQAEAEAASAALHADLAALSTALGAEVLSPIAFRMTAMRT